MSTQLDQIKQYPHLYERLKEVTYELEEWEKHGTFGLCGHISFEKLRPDECEFWSALCASLDHGTGWPWVKARYPDLFEQEEAWRAEKGELYYYRLFRCEGLNDVVDESEDGEGFDDDKYESGNYFQTEELALAVDQKPNQEESGEFVVKKGTVTDSPDTLIVFEPKQEEPKPVKTTISDTSGPDVCFGVLRKVTRDELIEEGFSVDVGTEGVVTLHSFTDSVVNVSAVAHDNSVVAGTREISPYNGGTVRIDIGAPCHAVDPKDLILTTKEDQEMIDRDGVAPAQVTIHGHFVEEYAPSLFVEHKSTVGPISRFET